MLALPLCKCYFEKCFIERNLKQKVRGNDVIGDATVFQFIPRVCLLPTNSQRTNRANHHVESSGPFFSSNQQPEKEPRQSQGRNKRAVCTINKRQSNEKQISATEFTCHHTKAKGTWASKFFHQRGVRKLLLQTENITVFLNQRPDCHAQHRMKKRRSVRVQPTGKQRGNSPMHREIWVGIHSAGIGFSHPPSSGYCLSYSR